MSPTALPQVAQLPRHRLEQRPAGIKALTLRSGDGEHVTTAHALFATVNPLG